jgi:uncharacterized protein (DUF488 family)
MQIYTIGFTQKTAEQFFEPLKQHGIRRLWDTRLNTTSQLAGFARRDHLPYLLKALCNAEYEHRLELAPTQELLDAFKKQKGRWDVYERDFLALMEARRIETELCPEMFAVPTVLLCSEATPEHCHRRLVAEYLQDKWGNLEIVHL